MGFRPLLVGSGSAQTWAASTPYLAGQLMSRLGRTYTRVSAGTSRSAFDVTEAAAWKPTAGNIDVRDYGAVGDARLITVSATGIALTGTGFTSADDGKTIVIAGAGAAGVQHKTTVTYVSSTSLTLAVSAPTSVTSVAAVVGTDDTAAFQAMVAAAFSAQTMFIPKPAGPIGFSYLITSAIAIPHGRTNLVFSGTSSLGASIYYAGTGDLFTNDVDDGLAYDANDYAGNENIQFKNMQLMHVTGSTPLENGIAKYTPGTCAIRDWRGGKVQLDNVRIQGFDYAFWGIQSDVNFWQNSEINSCHSGVYAGPRSDQWTFNSVLFTYCDRAVDIDSAYGTVFNQPRFINNGSATTNGIRIRSQYPRVAQQTVFNNAWFEHFIGDSRTVTASVSASSTSLTGTGFLSSDTGRRVIIPGAGAAGATLVTTVTYVDSTHLTLAVAASTTVSGATVTLATTIEAFVEVGVGDTYKALGVRFSYPIVLTNFTTDSVHTKYLCKTGNCDELLLSELAGIGNVCGIEAAFYHVDTVATPSIFARTKRDSPSGVVKLVQAGGAATPTFHREDWGFGNFGWGDGSGGRPQMYFVANGNFPQLIWENSSAVKTWILQAGLTNSQLLFISQQAANGYWAVRSATGAVDHLIFSEALDGLQVGASGHKLGFYGLATPIAKPTLAAAATDAATTQTLANDIRAKLIALGLTA